MALKIITRLKPCDLQEIQVQANVTVNGTLANVITALQYNWYQSHQNSPLNTACPTCAVAGDAKGFLTTTLNGNDVYYPCPTCAGYLIYHTANGALPAPVNPFNAPIVVKRTLPADLKQALAGFPDSTTLATMIVSLQANLADPVTNDCPVCNHTGWYTPQNVKTICFLCNGMQKTLNLFTYANGQIRRVIPNVALPNPLKVPEVPEGAGVTRIT